MGIDGYFFVALPSMPVVQLVPSCDISYLYVYEVGLTTFITAVRLKVEQNQLVGVFDEIGILFDALKGA